MVPQLGLPMVFLGPLLYKLGFTSLGILLFLGGALLSMGFGPFGIVAGSFASFVQSIIGCVASGSVFAVTQSLGALFWGRFPGLTLVLIFLLALWNGYI